MIQAHLHSSLEIDFRILVVVAVLGILSYFFQQRIYKECVLFLFRKADYGNISFIERKLVLNSQTHQIETIDKELLNVTNDEEDPKITVYVTDDKFYEWFLFYGERGLGEAFSHRYFQTDLLSLFEIIYGIRCREWTLHKYFVDGYMDFHPHYSRPTIEYSLRKDDQECIFFTDELVVEQEAHVILHNGLFPFHHTFIETCHPHQFVATDADLSSLEMVKMERISWEPEIGDVPDEKTLYYASFVKFLFQKKFLSYNHLFCKK